MINSLEEVKKHVKEIAGDMNNNLEIGIEKLKEAIEIEPNNAELLNKLGESLLRLETDSVLDQAKKVLEQSIKI